ncbi:MAG: hypothetical protein OHK0022_41750 [Roseiflexaceae bacterium]
MRKQQHHHLLSLALVLTAFWLSACTATQPAASEPLTWPQQKDLLLSKARSIDQDAYITTINAISPFPVNSSYSVPFILGAEMNTPSGKGVFIHYDELDKRQKLKILGQREGHWPIDPETVQQMPKRLDRVVLGPNDVLAVIGDKAREYASKRGDAFFSVQMTLFLLDTTGRSPYQPPAWIVLIPHPDEILVFWVDAEKGTLLEEKIQK